MIRRWFWRCYAALVTLVLLAVPLVACGPDIELAIAPVRTGQSIVDVTRVKDGASYVLGWTWVSTKRRDLVSNNMDVFVETRDGDVAVAAIYECATGELWARSRAVEASPIPHHQRYCVRLPPRVGPTDPVRVRQVAFYPGLFGLWQLPVQIPPVEDPGFVPLP